MGFITVKQNTSSLAMTGLQDLLQNSTEQEVSDPSYFYHCIAFIFFL